MKKEKRSKLAPPTALGCTLTSLPCQAAGTSGLGEEEEDETGWHTWAPALPKWDGRDLLKLFA